VKKYKLAYFVNHPIQYQVPLYKKLAKDPDIEFKVFYLDSGTSKERLDKGFGKKVQWDTPMLEGYDFEFLPQVRSNNSGQYGFLNPVTFSISNYLRQGDWDAAWFHGYANLSLLLGIIECSRIGVPVFFRGESNLIYSGGGRLSTALIKWIIRRAHALLWVGSLNKDYYEAYGADPEQLFFCPYTVDNEHFQSEILKAKERREKLIETLDIDQSLPVIVYAGKLMRRKNAHILLKAFLESCELNNGAIGNLIFVGDGELRNEIELKISQTKYKRYIRIAGFQNQSELPSYYDLADLFVIPSEKEPFGLVVNEAMNGSCAVIGTDEVGACRDLVEEGKNGYIVKAGCSESLKEKLLIATSDMSRLKQMGKESLAKINRWSYSENIKGIKSALTSIE
jgi:glycosyltransferase involved in cell wall biosynthesis